MSLHVVAPHKDALGCIAEAPPTTMMGHLDRWPKISERSLARRGRAPIERKPASETPWTSKLWIYDLRTNQHFTLKQNTLSVQALQDFVTCYKAEDRSKREDTEQFRVFSYEDLVSRDKANLDIFWLKEKSLEGLKIYSHRM